MADARTEAIEALLQALLAESTGTLDHDCGEALDAIPTAALVRLVIERGGLEQVGWGGCDEYANCDEDGHEWDLFHEDGTGQIDDEHPRWPVYRIAEEPTGAEMAAQAAVIARYRDGWVENHTDSEPNGTWWHPPRGEVEPMTDAERRVLYPEEADRG